MLMVLLQPRVIGMEKMHASWTCSVDKYYQMLQQTGNEGIITINYGYARYGTAANPVAAAAHLGCRLGEDMIKAVLNIGK